MGAIVGGVIGGLVLVGITAAIFVVLRKRHTQAKAEVMKQAPHPLPLVPYGQDPSIGPMRGAHGSNAISPSQDPPSRAKAREVLLSRMRQDAPSDSIATSSNISSQTALASSRDPLSPGGLHSVSSTEVLGLRAEVEHLRRVIQGIQVERLESPPEYAEE